MQSRKQCNKIFPMDQLPIELWFLIFDYLDLRSLKFASRTCRRWHEVIFSTPYISRFAFSNCRWVIAYKRPLSEVWNEMARQIEKSHRCYKNLTLVSYNESCRPTVEFNVLFQSIRCHMLDKLVELTLKFIPDQMLSMIFDAIPQMSRLAILHLRCEYENYTSTLRLKSNTLRHLQLNSFFLTSLDLPALKSLDMIDLSPGIDLGRLDNWHFLDNLEQLMFFQHENFSPLMILSSQPENRRPIYRQLSQLRTLFLFKIIMSESVLMAIGKSCTGLTELSISCEWMKDSQPVHHFPNLPHLRRLTIWDDFSQLKLSFASTSLLPNLEHIEVDYSALTRDSFTALGAVKSLTLGLAHPQNGSETILTIARHLPNLTVLRLKLGELIETELTSVLHSLHLLTTVKQMVLQSKNLLGTFLRDDAYQLDTPPMHGLRSVLFRNWRNRPPKPWVDHMFPNASHDYIKNCTIQHFYGSSDSEEF